VAIRSEIDWKAVLPAAVFVVAVGVVVNVVANVVGLDSSSKSDSSALLAFYLVDLVAAAGGGWWAARRRMETPLLHGALVGFCAYVVIAILSTLINTAAGHGVPRVQFLIFNAFMLTAAGLFGGWIASARGRPAPS
jgi:putative membrane protein (TIGR04086 family)